MKVFINTKRNGYAPNQCGRTMTVGELIEVLENFDEEAEIYFRNDNGYTYGSIMKYDLEDGYEDEDE